VRATNFEKLTDLSLKDCAKASKNSGEKDEFLEALRGSLTRCVP